MQRALLSTMLDVGWRRLTIRQRMRVLAQSPKRDAPPDF